MTVFELLQSVTFDTLYPFLRESDLRTVALHRYQLREAYDLLRQTRTNQPSELTHIPVPVVLTNRTGNLEQSLAFPNQRLTEQDLGLSIQPLRGVPLFPAELAAQCLVSYLTQPEAEKQVIGNQEPLFTRTREFKPYPIPILTRRIVLEDPKNGDVETNLRYVIEQATYPRGIEEKKAIQEERDQLIWQWHDCLTLSERTVLQNMHHAQLYTYRAMDQTLGYLLYSITQDTELEIGTYDKAFCRVDHPEESLIPPASWEKFKDALMNSLGIELVCRYRPSKTIQRFQCQLLLIATRPTPKRK